MNVLIGVVAFLLAFCWTVVKTGRDKSVLVFITAQIFNIFLTFAVAWLLFGGIIR